MYAKRSWFVLAKREKRFVSSSMLSTWRLITQFLIGQKIGKIFNPSDTKLSIYKKSFKIELFR